MTEIERFKRVIEANRKTTVIEAVGVGDLGTIYQASDATMRATNEAVEGVDQKVDLPLLDRIQFVFRH